MPVSQTLAITLDVPINSKRERNIRNGFVRPLKLTSDQDGGLPASGLDGRVLAPRHAAVRQLAALCAGGLHDRPDRRVRRHQTPSPVLWKDVENFRRMWPGKLVLKGVMHPDDATRAAAMGVDGVMVSNHGGRQLDRAPSPIEVLPAIPAAVGDKMTVMFDSGIRRGSDVIVALCLGAKFVFVGTPHSLRSGGGRRAWRGAGPRHLQGRGPPASRPGSASFALPGSSPSTSRPATPRPSSRSPS